jgi:hypothetical protein
MIIFFQFAGKQVPRKDDRLRFAICRIGPRLGGRHVEIGCNIFFSFENIFEMRFAEKRRQQSAQSGKNRHEYLVTIYVLTPGLLFMIGGPKHSLQHF